SGAPCCFPDGCRCPCDSVFILPFHARAEFARTSQVVSGHRHLRTTSFTASVPRSIFSEITHTIDEVTSMRARFLFTAMCLPLLPDLRVDGIYQRYTAGEDANVDILGGGVNVLLDMPLVVIKPYIIAGVGYYDVSFDSDLAEDDASNAEFGFTGGAGVRLGLGRLGVFAEARALRIGGDADLSTVPVLVGITF